jgi:hypothetical protein
MIVSIRLTPCRGWRNVRFIELTLSKTKRSVGLIAARERHDRPVRTIGVKVIFGDVYFFEKTPVLRE